LFGDIIGIKNTVTVTITGAQVIAGGATVGTLVLMASGKTSTERPFWVNRDMVDETLSAQENATDILNNKYGVGNWRKGPGTEYNKIIKWIERHLRFKY